MLDAPNPSDHPRARLKVLALLLAVFTVVAGPILFLEYFRPDSITPDDPRWWRGVTEIFDQDEYHLPIIRRFADEFPDVDLVEYPSATTPAFHLLMATVLRATGSLALTKTANFALTLCLITAIYWPMTRWIGPWRAAALTLPLLFNPYVVGAAVWLTTDNVGLLFASVVLGGTVFYGFTRTRIGLISLASVGAVLVRQIHVWTIAPIGFVGLLASPLAGWIPARFRPEGPPSEGSWTDLAIACVAAAIPALVLGGFIIAWGGLVPVDEAIRQKHASEPNFAGPAFALSMVGIYGPLLLGRAWVARTLRARRDPMLYLVAALAAAVVLVPDTGWSRGVNDFGWLWHVLRQVQFEGRSILMLPLAISGALSLLVFYRAAREAGNGWRAALLLLSLSGWLCAQAANRTAWQRYFEPMVLLALAWLAALGLTGTRRTAGPESLTGGPDRERTWSAALSTWAGPAVLTMIQVVVAVYTVHLRVARETLF